MLQVSSKDIQFPSPILATSYPDSAQALAIRLLPLTESCKPNDSAIISSLGRHPSDRYATSTPPIYSELFTRLRGSSMRNPDRARWPW